jgi:hypothetical protein
MAPLPGGGSVRTSIITHWSTPVDDVMVISEFIIFFFFSEDDEAADN